MTKINIGALSDNANYNGLYFDDRVFEGIPTKLRVDPKNFNPKSEYDNVKKEYIDNTLSTIKFSARDEGLLQSLVALKNDTILKQVASGLAQMEMHINIPEKDTAEYNDLLNWTEKVKAGIDKNKGKDIIFDKAVCHVVPMLKANTYGAYRGLQLRLFNPTQLKVSFAQPLDLCGYNHAET